MSPAATPGATGQAIVLMVLTVFFFSAMDATARVLAQDHHTFQVVWARYTSQTLIAFIFLAPRLPTLLRTRFFGLQLLRSALLFGATISFFFGFVAIGLAPAAAIMATNPLLITLLAMAVLGEVVGARRLIGVAAGLIGALVIIRPGTAVFDPHALLPLFAAICYAGYAISTRFLGQEESPWTSFLYTALIGAVAACVAVPFFWTTPDLAAIGLMGLLGVVGGIGHICLIRALTLAEASVIAPAAYAGLIFAVFWGIVIFGDYPDRVTYLGMAIIAGAGTYVWSRERAAARLAARAAA